MNPPPSTAPKRPIRALTVINPWAAFLAAGVKPVENRTWPPHGLVPGDFLAIHAGVWAARKTLDQWGAALELAEAHGLVDALPLLAGFREIVDGPRGRLYAARCTAYCERAVPYGAIVAVATLDEVRRSARVIDGAPDPWFCGPVGWYLRQITPIDPVPCRGAQGLWTPADDVLATVRDRYRATRARGVCPVAAP